MDLGREKNRIDAEDKAIRPGGEAMDISSGFIIKESFVNKRMVHGSLYGRAYNSKELSYKRCKGKRGVFGI